MGGFPPKLFVKDKTMKIRKFRIYKNNEKYFCEYRWFFMWFSFGETTVFDMKFKPHEFTSFSEAYEFIKNYVTVNEKGKKNLIMECDYKTIASEIYNG